MKVTLRQIEGFLAVADRGYGEGLRLVLDHGIFFEFVPFNRDNFDEYGNIRPEAKACTIAQVEKGEDYALVISTNAGLWRYLVGDLVQFTDVERREIKISGRMRQYLSLVGEHLSLDNINTAMMKATDELDITIREFCLFPDTVNQNHCWYFGTEKDIDTALVMKTIDKYLGELNDDYYSVRKYDTLHDPKATQIPVDLFYKFIEERGKFGSQSKIPRVMNAHQSKEWQLFLKEKLNLH